MPKRKKATKKAVKTVRHRRNEPMATKKVSYRTRVKKVYSRGRSLLGGGGFGTTAVGLGAGVARQVGNKFLPGYGAPLAEFGIGFLTKNQTALYMAGRDLGGMVSAGFVGAGTTQTNGGAYL